jgi:hypothetical protein
MCITVLNATFIFCFICILSYCNMFWPSSCMCESCYFVFLIGSGRVNCCWSTPTQPFLVPGPAGFMTIFYSSACLVLFSRYQLRNSAAKPAIQMTVFMYCLSVSCRVPAWYILICHSHFLLNPFMVIFPSHLMLEACRQRHKKSNFV